MFKIQLQNRRTKIVATLGPSSIPKIPDLIIAGVNVFRLNFSHIADPETQDGVIDTIRSVSADLKIPVAILGDLCGPKIRCNAFEGTPSIFLKTGDTVRLIYSEENGKEGLITTTIKAIVHEIKLGHRILLDDGNLALKGKAHPFDL